MRLTDLRRLLTRTLLGRPLPWLVLALALALTYRLYLEERQATLHKLRLEFDFRVNDTASRLQQRMQTYLQVLHGAQGLFAASPSVSREAFRAYATALALETNHPGIQGIGFAQQVHPTETAGHMAALRRQGLDSYAIHPLERDQIAAPLAYIEPPNERNQAVLGFNLYAEPLRRAALEQARDSGQVAVSGKLALRPEPTGLGPTGFLVVLPVYRNGAAHASVDARRDSLRGWIVAPFLMNDLMLRTLGGHPTDLDVEIHDGAAPSSHLLLYDSDASRTRRASPGKPVRPALFKAERGIDVLGHAWTMQVHSLPDFEARLDTRNARLIAGAGVSISLLLAWLGGLLVHGWSHARQAAREMNRDLAESEQQARQAHARLREAEELHRFALEGAGMGVWDWNLASGHIGFSPRYREIMPCVADESRPALEQLTQCVAPDDLPRMRAELQACLDRQTSTYRSEYRVLGQDGQPRWVLNRGLAIGRAADGRPTRMVGTVVDVSARKQTEQELRDARQQAERALAELSSYLQAIGQHALISITDLDGGIIEVNDRFCQVSGYSREELLGQRHRIMNSGAHPAGFFSELWHTLTHGGIWRGEICDRAKDGSLFWTDTVILPFNPEGSFKRYLSVRLDITRRKNAEAELVRATVAAAVADHESASKSAFMANMSHEIRTPMNTIIGMAHLALDNEADPRQRDYLGKIQHASEHLLDIINNILDFSRIEADKLVLESVDFELGSVIRNVQSQLRDSAKAKGLKLECDIDARLPPVLRGDPLRLRQILLNYVSNAVKFTHQGRIDVRARLIEEGSGACLVRLEVRDTGIGMSEAEMAQIFQPFHQADASTTRLYGGTGLGLAISKQLAELMGGEVGVESRPGLGSTFWFTARLGRGDGQAVSAPKAAGATEPALPRGTSVLLVEDNLLNQQVASELLRRAGVAVTIANNGQEAIEHLRQTSFDWVLMDVQMPVLDGLEATRKIRATPELAATRIIGLSANTSAEDRARCLDAGMDDFLGKPFHPAQLLALLAGGRRDVPAPLLPDPPAAADAGDGSELDLSILGQSVSHDPGKLRKYARMFVASMHETLAELEAALAGADLSTAAALGHRAKSSARTVGALGFAALCQEMESCKHDHNTDQARAIIDRMRPLLERISARVDQEFPA